MNKPNNIDKKAGFNRLKGLAAAAVMGAGAMGMAIPLTVRANNSNTFNINRNFGNSNTNRTQTVRWEGVGIQSSSTTDYQSRYIYTSTYTSNSVWTTRTYNYNYNYYPIPTNECSPSPSPSPFSGRPLARSYSCGSTTTTTTTTSTITYTSTWTNTSTYTFYNTSQAWEALNLIDTQGETITNNYPTNFGISDVSYFKEAGSTDLSATSLFDGVLGFSVDENTFIPPSGSVSMSFETLSVDSQVDIVGGIDANVEYYFSKDAPFVRALYTLTNTYTTTTKDVELAVNGRLNFGGSTIVVASSDDTTTLDDGDEWVVLGYNNERRGYSYDNPPVIAFGRFGGEAPLVTPTNDGVIEDGEFLQTYDLSIPPNSSRSVMVYMALAADLDAAKATVTDLSENPEVLLEGLSEEEIASIVNYDFSEDPDPEVKKKKDNDTFLGAFDLAFLLGAAGTLVIRNKKKK